MTEPRPSGSRADRRKLAHRRRRIVFNNDGDDLSSMLLKGTEASRRHGVKPLIGMAEVEKLRDLEATDAIAKPGAAPTAADALLRERTTALLGSHVDAIWYYSTYGMRLHHDRNTAFGKLYACSASPVLAKTLENYRRLIEEGHDTLEVMVKVCRDRGMEIFYSNRMNDCHDSFNTALTYHIRREHPEWSLSTPEQGKKYQYPDPRSCWTAWALIFTTCGTYSKSRPIQNSPKTSSYCLMLSRTRRLKRRHWNELCGVSCM